MADEFVAATGVRRGSFGWSSSMENTTTGARKRSTFDYDREDDDQTSPSMAFLDFHDESHHPLQDYTLNSSSCSTYDWNNNQVLIDAGNERSESDYNSAEQEDVLTNYQQTDLSSSGNISLTRANFPTINGSLNSSYNYNSPFAVQSLLDHDDQDQDQDQEPGRPQQSFYDNNYQFSPPWTSKLSSNFTKPLISKHLTSNNLHTSNSLPFWTNVVDYASSFHHQIMNRGYEEKQNCIKRMKNSSNEPTTFKRPRIETPSSLPTFKVRKEKLGDRITALQQLVSPFGKTDTASVLHEAIQYIKFLHDQVGVHSSPYMKSSSQNAQLQQMPRKMKDLEVTKQDLRTRGLCLFPISSTYPVANEPTSDFWTPTFGGTFR